MPLVLHEAAEMYLETIYTLEQETERVRAVDIASRMGYSKPTISEWLGKLREAGYVAVNGTRISLTPTGREVAERIFERHTVLTKLFQAVGVSPEVAAEDACRVEHYISDETFDCLKAHFEAHR